jgi:hypothetical protein
MRRDSGEERQCHRNASPSTPYISAGHSKIDVNGPNETSLSGAILIWRNITLSFRDFDVNSSDWRAKRHVGT